MDTNFASREGETRSELHIRLASLILLQWDEATLKILDGKIKQTFLCHRFSHVRTFEIILCKSNHFKFMISYSSKALYHDIRVRESEWLKEGRPKSHSTSREVSK